MTIAVRPYLPDDLSAIHNLYNALLVGRVPHCWPVASSSLEETLQAGEIEREETRLLEQAVLVAGSGGDGFVHVGRQATNKWRKDEIGVIRFLAYRRGERAVGDALLAAAESWMRERNLRRSVVMPQPWRYPFMPSPTPTCPITSITCRPWCASAATSRLAARCFSTGWTCSRSWLAMLVDSTTSFASRIARGPVSDRVAAPSRSGRRRYRRVRVGQRC